MDIFKIVFYIFSFISIWWGAGLIINSIDKAARRLKLSTFAISFFILGLLTSIPETAISIQAVADHNPEIFVGTLLGGTVVIFLLIIPILAIMGKEIKINRDLNRKMLIYALTVMSLPSIMILDQRVTNQEGVILIISYSILLYIIQRRHGVFNKNEAKVMKSRAYSFFDLAKVMLGIVIVFLSSQFIVDQTISYSQILKIPTFYISLLLLSFGTNLPELSIAVRSIVSGKKEIAFGDYLGSASANTLLFGIFTLINDGEVLTINGFKATFGFIVVGLGLFYYFSQSKRNISYKEGWILLAVYGLFLAFEAIKATLG